MTKGKLCDMLIDVAKDYKKEGILESLKRNKHMSEYKGEHIKDNVIDALLVDFINRVAMYQGLDLGLYTKHLNEEKELADYYYENSVTTILSHMGRDHISKELQLCGYRCRVCGGPLMIITMMEGSFLKCIDYEFKHNCGYCIDMSNHKKPPTIVDWDEDRD